MVQLRKEAAPQPPPRCHECGSEKEFEGLCEDCFDLLHGALRPTTRLLATLALDVYGEVSVAVAGLAPVRGRLDQPSLFEELS